MSEEHERERETRGDPDSDRATRHLLDSGVDLATEEDLDVGQPDLSGQASKGFLWVLTGFMIVQIGGFGTFVLAGNWLTPDELGIAGKVLTVIFWMDVLLDVGMGANVIHEQESGQTHRVRVAFTVNTILAVTVSLGMFLLAPVIAGFFNIPDEANLFRMLGLLALVKGLSQIPDSILRRDMVFWPRTAVNLVRASVRFGLALVMLLSGAGPAAMVVSVVVADVCAAIMVTLFARFVPRFAFDWKASVEMLRYGLAIFGARTVSMLWLNGDYLVIGRRLSNKDFGDYWTAFRLPELALGSVYNIFSTVLFPAYSAARERGPETIREAYLRAMRLLFLYGAAVSVALALIARDFITVVFSTHPGAIRPMEILSLAGAFVAIGYASGDLFNAMGKPKIGLYFALLGTPILIIGFLLVVDQGIVAVALVHLIVVVPYTVVRLEVANRLIGCNWRQSLGALRAGASAAAGILAFALPVRLVTEAGLVSGLAIVAAGTVGGAVGLALGDREAILEIWGLVRKAVKR